MKKKELKNYLKKIHPNFVDDEWLTKFRGQLGFFVDNYPARERVRRQFFNFNLIYNFKFATVLAAIFVVLFGSIGAVSAAQGSMPGDLLYPIKIVSEKIIIGVAPKTQKLSLSSTFAGRRVSEAQFLVNQGERINDVAVINLLNEYEKYTKKIQNILENDLAVGAVRGDNTELIQQLTMNNKDQEAALQRLHVQVNISLRPAVTTAEINQIGSKKFIIKMDLTPSLSSTTRVLAPASGDSHVKEVNIPPPITLGNVLNDQKSSVPEINSVPPPRVVNSDITGDLELSTKAKEQIDLAENNINKLDIIEDEFLVNYPNNGLSASYAVKYGELLNKMVNTKEFYKVGNYHDALEWANDVQRMANELILSLEKSAINLRLKINSQPIMINPPMKVNPNLNPIEARENLPVKTEQLRIQPRGD